MGGESTGHVHAASVSATQAWPKLCPLLRSCPTERTFSNLCASLQCLPTPTPLQQTQGRQLQAGSWLTCSLLL